MSSTVGRPDSRNSLRDTGETTKPQHLQRSIIWVAFVAVVAILAVELTHSDREPVNGWLSGSALLLAGVGAGIGIGRARLAWLAAPVVGGVAWLSGGLVAGRSSYDAILATIVVVPTLAVGVAQPDWSPGDCSPTGHGPARRSGRSRRARS